MGRVEPHDTRTDPVQLLADNLLLDNRIATIQPETRWTGSCHHVRQPCRSRIDLGRRGDDRLQRLQTRVLSNCGSNVGQLSPG